MRTALVLCVLAVATTAAAQTRDSGALRGLFASDSSGIDVWNEGTEPDDDLLGDGSYGKDLSTTSTRSTTGTDKTATDTNAESETGAAMPPERPLGPSPEDEAAAAGPVQPVAPVAPLTTGSIRQANVVDGSLVGDTVRDAPRGIRAGNFLLFPELIMRGGATSNVQGAAGGEAGSFYRVDPSVRISSDWDRHALELNLRGNFTGYPDAPTGAQDDDITGRGHRLAAHRCGRGDYSGCPRLLYGQSGIPVEFGKPERLEANLSARAFRLAGSDARCRARRVDAAGRARRQSLYRRIGRRGA